MKIKNGYCRVCGKRGINGRTCSVQCKKTYDAANERLNEKVLDAMQIMYGEREYFRSEDDWQRRFGFNPNAPDY